MDIKLKPRPWYVKYLYHILFGLAFVAFAVYVITLSLGPRHLTIDKE